jgi:iron complex transport system substrate-binding protein
MRLRTTDGRGCLVLAAAMLLAAAPRPAAEQASGKPTRIVSLNMCADELVLRLADPQHIASVTWLSRDPRDSNVASLAARVPVNHGLAEEIIPLKPDLVVAGAHTTRTAVAMVRRVGVPLDELDVPENLEDVRRQIRRVAGLVGEPERGEKIIDGMNVALAALPAAPQSGRPRAIVLNPNGVTVGKGTLVDELMTRAGLVNVAAQIDLGNYGQVPLEVLVANPIDVLILGSSRDGAPSLATEILRHPVLSALARRARLVVMPGRLWSCGGPAVVEAIERLARVAEVVRGGAATR